MSEVSDSELLAEALMGLEEMRIHQDCEDYLTATTVAGETLEWVVSILTDRRNRG